LPSASPPIEQAPANCKVGTCFSPHTYGWMEAKRGMIKSRAAHRARSPSNWQVKENLWETI
jgi:hypothetical protein